MSPSRRSWRVERPVKPRGLAVEAAGGHGLIVQGDVRRGEDCSRIVQTTVDELGSLDIFVNNASIPFAIKPFLEMSWDEFSTKVNDELFAAFSMCQAVAPHMAANGDGDIVLISSVMSRAPVRNFCSHGTAKAAVSQFARYLAKELGPSGVRTNVIAPGLTLTDATVGVPEALRAEIVAQTPPRRLTTVEDVAGAVLSVVAGWNRQLNCAYIPVNGGIEMN